MKWAALINAISALIETAVKHWPRKKEKNAKSRWKEVPVYEEREGRGEESPRAGEAEG